MSTNTNRPTYGLFYKSRGVFTGPYRNRLYTLPQAKAVKPQVKETLKSVVLIRKVVAA